MEILELTDLVRQTAFEVHSFLGNGHLERIYESALIHRLDKLGIRARQQVPLAVYDQDGHLLGSYCGDLFVEEKLLVELKAVKALTHEHEAQVFAYLKSCRLKHAVLINFGSYRFQIRKYASPFC